MANTVLTFDAGTTGLKCSLFGPRCDEIAAVVEGYPTRYPKPGWAEQDPADYWRAATVACRALFSRSGAEPRQVAAIGLSGHMNGCLPVDASGNPVYSAIIHSDGRSVGQCRAILDRIAQGDFYRTTGNRADSHFTLPKLLWIRDNLPAVYDATAFFLNAKDYLRSMLLGTTGLTDFSDASLTCCLDIGRRRWSRELAAELGFDIGKLPEIRAADEMAGKLSRGAAEQLGLVEGIPVAVGGGDAACATAGALLRAEAEAYVSLGSSAWISKLADRPLFDPAMRMQNFYDLDGNRCNICGTVQSASIAIDWALGAIGLGPDEDGTEESPGRALRSAFSRLEAAAGRVAPGSGGVLFLPYLMGERTPLWDPNARGAFVGLSLATDRASMLRAVLEGVAMALRDVLAAYADLGLAIDRLILLGGGAQSGLWRRILCDVLGLPVRLHPLPVEAASLGAALSAGRAVGLYGRAEPEPRGTTIEGLDPDPMAAERYRRQWEIFDLIQRGLNPLTDAIADLARGREKEDRA